MGVTAVPEPQTWALMLAGLAAAGVAARRRAHGKRASWTRVLGTRPMRALPRLWAAAALLVWALWPMKLAAAPVLPGHWQGQIAGQTIALTLQALSARPRCELPPQTRRLPRAS
jgi:hypothetical protein